MISSNEVKSLCLLGVRIKRVQFRKKCFFLSPGTKQTVRIKEVSVKRGLTVELLACLLAQFQPRGTQARLSNSGL